MGKKKIIVGLILFAAVIFINIYLVNTENKIDDEITMQLQLTADDDMSVGVYYLTDEQPLDNGFVAAQVVSEDYTQVGKRQSLAYQLPANVAYIRLDPGEKKNSLSISSIEFSYKKNVITALKLSKESVLVQNQLEFMEEEGGRLVIHTLDGDPYFAFGLDVDSITRYMKEALAGKWLARKVLMCFAIDLILFLFWLKMDTLLIIPGEIWDSKRLIYNLSKNDFKVKFAGSYFGIVWAFIQPIVTVLVYWFVFEKALNAGTQATKAGIDAPYVLWLIAGLVPWFYFSEVLGAGTNALVEYNYLVKKVVFKISTLPVVKLISSLYVHLFFVAFMIVLYCFLGYYPNIYFLQLIYYSFCMVILCLGIIYFTSAIVVFFRDLSQVIGIILQVGIWMTPIMWNIDTMASRIPKVLLLILKMNPMFYIVSGYRDSLLNQVWFWEQPGLTVYFWSVTLIVLAFGMTVFRKLQIHFADVL